MGIRRPPGFFKHDGEVGWGLYSEVKYTAYGEVRDIESAEMPMKYKYIGQLEVMCGSDNPPIYCPIRAIPEEPKKKAIQSQGFNRF